MKAKVIWRSLPLYLKVTGVHAVVSELSISIWFPYNFAESVSHKLNVQR